jgi:hypothetical protein
MAKFSKKMMGKEVGDAEVYAKPHDMKGRALKTGSIPPSKVTRDPNTLSANEVTTKSGSMRVSMGNPAREDVKTTGMKQRGSGAATRGFTSRGPMA